MGRRVTIVGAGPAGLTAAITLARAGWRVVVCERHPGVGRRFAGDFQGLENWSEAVDVLEWVRRMGVQVRFEAAPFHVVTFYGPDGRPRVLRTPRPLFYLVRRGDVAGSLDRGLLAEALEAGVEIRFGKALRHVEGPAIIATGPRFGDGICVGYTFTTDLPDQAHCILSDRLAPLGYAYLLIRAGRATLVSCQFARLQEWRAHLARTVEAFSRIVPGLELREARFFSGYGNVFTPPRLVDHGRYYVGEAAGLQDALWGFGLRYAIRSGYLAAQSLIRGVSYAALARRELLPRHRVGLENRALLEASRALLGERVYAWLLDRVVQHPDVRAYLRKHHRPLAWKRALWPLVRLGMRFRSRYRDARCRLRDCTCVWCACGRSGRNECDRMKSPVSTTGTPSSTI
ncbi:NAD(P)/FAD-dependent oxidoreductase [Marinithermus hydrothermalis]|uniref:FAD-dependent pyridine nucleotide-disulfide oxidoreductase n=1 Tax=Marinithermus hydrothermalis (strain DSM 14884 / JCM 11576 / T1) TaxID=869210 RepID=F2NLF3_MARHT|nr:NAD(P)/FAD-dependent oxidoreductase [Marinithermus hydrothermalis]AEB11772.1 FAD-dependent pyridine nucleotide-disulfide oxidoreductase [Marinithermus hydrothermalis DSM 14884]